MKNVLSFILLIILSSGVMAMSTMPRQGSDDKIWIYDARQGVMVKVPRMIKPDSEWEKILPKDVYEITVKQGTEAPGSCSLMEIKDTGIYECARCGIDLFRSGTKFDSGTGWPSFFEPVSKYNIKEREDNGQGMKRIEVICARCDAHLGHVFDDGPAPSNKRYCINGTALRFSEYDATGIEKAGFAAGCFWHVQDEFDKINGVVNTTVGYMGGEPGDPTYEKVCSGNTGHAEAVFVEFDPSKVSYGKLLGDFFIMHDPTQVGGQGVDIGDQYRSAVFYYNDAQKETAIKFRDALEASGQYKSKIVTAIEPAKEFYKAEEYHQKYMEKNRK